MTDPLLPVSVHHAWSAEAVNATTMVPSPSVSRQVRPEGTALSTPLLHTRTTDGVANDKMERRRKRQRLRKYCRRRGANNLSFVELLALDWTVSDDDDSDDNETSQHVPAQERPVEDDDVPILERVVLDVDVELGFPPLVDTVGSSEDWPHQYSPERVVSYRRHNATPTTRLFPDGAVSNPATGRSLRPRASPSSVPTRLVVEVTPQDEGYYEGVVSPMTMPDDELYLSPLHIWLRQNLEFFSAIPADTHSGQGGRRVPIVRGKVGIRCLHCAQAMMESAASTSTTSSDPVVAFGDPNRAKKTYGTISYTTSWPSGTTSYPPTLAVLHSTCAPKTTQHFSTCPNLPSDRRGQLDALTREGSAARGPRASATLSTGEGHGTTNLSASLYYTIAAKQLGIIEVKDQGLRFGRDLALGPLPLEPIRGQVEAEQHKHEAANNAASLQPRIVADEESERVLAEAVAEPDQPNKYFARSNDKALVSDYIFLTIRQMAVCHAVPSDFSSRGKRTKSMRIGLTGFCCRHCQSPRQGAGPDYSCRSFTSAPDNLSSSISHSFTAHLLKCAKVPRRIQTALMAYKRLHHRQMAQLPYGSQRRLFHDLWTRLRALDKDPSEMTEEMEAMNIPEHVPSFLSRQASPAGALDASGSAPVFSQSSEASAVGTTRVQEVLPSINDDETDSILTVAQTKWDPTTNDYLLLPEDRSLITDFIFLIVRQLKLAIPNESDLARVRRYTPGTLGLCCLHCKDQDSSVTPSGRTFPSAPDNFASALNTSMYSHMKACPYVPDDLKRALVATRKVHSSQCASLRFGSQRQFFKTLFARLNPGTNGSVPTAVRNASLSPPASTTNGGPTTTDEGLRTLGFIGMIDTFLCRHCRAVPFPFRAPHSIVSARRKDTLRLAQLHAQACHQTKWDWNLMKQVFWQALKGMGLPRDSVETKEFAAWGRSLSGSNESFGASMVANLRGQALEESDVSTRGSGVVSTDVVDVAQVEKLFHDFVTASGSSNVSSRLRLHPALMDFILLAFPTFDPDKLLPLEETGTMPATIESQSETALEHRPPKASPRPHVTASALETDEPLDKDDLGLGTTVASNEPNSPVAPKRFEHGLLAAPPGTPTP
jgi:hypothetical protein